MIYNVGYVKFIPDKSYHNRNHSKDRGELTNNPRILVNRRHASQTSPFGYGVRERTRSVVAITVVELLPLRPLDRVPLQGNQQTDVLEIAQREIDGVQFPGRGGGQPAEAMLFLVRVLKVLDGGNKHIG